MADETKQDAQDVQDVDLTAGLENGSPVVDDQGNDTGEVIVHEKDKNGNVTGWHKEAK